MMNSTEHLLQKIKDKELFIVTVESITGGAIINELTNIPGFSDVIYGGIVVYNVIAKNELLSKVTHDVYSHSFVHKMCLDALDKYSGTLAIAISGNSDNTKTSKIDGENASFEYWLCFGCHEQFKNIYVIEKNDEIDNIYDKIERRITINDIIVSNIIKELHLYLDSI